MSSTFVFRSPNEIAKLEEQERKRQRIARLKQVREQEREVAQRKRIQYQNNAAKEWETVTSELKARRDQGVFKTINRINQQEQRASSTIGASQRRAALERVQETFNREKLLQTVVQRQRESQTRFEDAVDTFREEKHLESQKLRHLLALRQKIHEQEAQRAHRLAEKQRERAALQFDVEIPKQPLQQLNRTKVQMRRRHDKSKLQYDDTAYHRNYTVTRCYGVRSENAMTAAEQARIAREQLAQIRQEESEKNNAKAQQRFEKAIHTVHMEKEREAMESELKSLNEKDKKRRTEITVATTRARPFYEDYKMHDILHAFEKQFVIQK